MTFIKRCTTCNESKNSCEFYNLKASKDGKSYRCKICDYSARNKYHVENYDRLKIKLRDNQRKFKYGLSREDYKNIWNSQKGCCLICDTELDDSFGKHHKPNKAVIDHCHNTGNIRGLLCTMCNKGIGLLKDDPKILDKARNYLLNAEIH